MSYVNFDKYPSWLSWRVIRIEEGWLTEPVIFFVGHYIHYETMFFPFNSICIFLIIIIWSRKKKGNNNYCDLKKIN